MEGPTPVSALIHAATMVAAGVYLVARMYGFYALSPTALAVIAFVGGFTALFAASMAVVKRDVKQVLAYSTISQYGYMMLGLGAGGYVAAVFHLMTHAFFKALLFLGAGAVIIAMHHRQDMWEMGGLREKLPVTYYTFLAGSLALAGIVPFAGFWSKDEVLYEALVHGLTDPLLLVAYLMGLIAVFFTGFYTFRMVLLTFHGEPRTHTARNPHTLGWNVKFPLVVLGILATVIGLTNMTPVAEATGLEIEFLHTWLEHGIEGLNSEHYGELLETVAGYSAAELSPLLAAALSLALALGGAGLAYSLYSGDRPDRHTDRLGDARTLLMNNYYQDEYQVWIAETFGTGVARLSDRFDQSIVDGAVNGVSSVSLFSGGRIRRIQTGIVSNYATLLTLGLVALLLVVGLTGGWFL
jgi:NADH-quinone oxidoreductase subunit L